MSQADFNKFLKLEKRLGKLIDNPTGSSSRALMKRKENLRRRLKVLEPKIKGFEEGGEAKPLVGGQKKLDKNKDGRISGDDFAMMKDGGVAKRTKEEKIYGELPKGSKGRGMQNTFNNVKRLEAMARGDALELGSLVDIPERRRKFSQSIKQVQRDPSGTKNVYRGQGDVITSSQEEERAEKAKTKPKKMKMGGKVEEYGGGGSVKGGKMSCRGMGAAIKGGGFKIR